MFAVHELFPSFNLIQTRHESSQIQLVSRIALQLHNYHPLFDSWICMVRVTKHVGNRGNKYDIIPSEIKNSPRLLLLCPSIQSHALRSHNWHRACNCSSGRFGVTLLANLYSNLLRIRSRMSSRSVAIVPTLVSLPIRYEYRDPSDFMSRPSHGGVHHNYDHQQQVSR